MKKNSLFIKTWLMTIFTIIATATLLIFIYTYQLSSSMRNEQYQSLQDDINKIKNYVHTHGIDKENIPKTKSQIVIKENDNIVYTHDYVTIQMDNDTATMLPKETINGSPIKDSEGVMESIQESVNTTFKDHTYNISATTLSFNYFPILLAYIKNLFPFFIIIGILVSSVIAYIYSSYFARRIRNLKNIAEDMRQREHQITTIEKQGDEITILENNMNHMYNDLCNALQTIEEENLYIKKLETNRLFFTRGATHELKTPIMSVMSVLEGLIYKVKGFEDTGYYYQECYKQMIGMKKLVNEILELSQLQQIQVEGSCDIKKTLETVLEQYQIDFYNHPIHTLNDHSQSINISENNMIKIFSNLLHNAIKYGMPNKEITISYDADQIQITNTIREGLSDINLDDIFTPFVSFSEEDDDSHGLGLYLVKVILEQSNYTCDCKIHNQEFIFTICLSEKEV